MSRQLQAQHYLELVKARTGRVFGQMCREFDQIVSRFASLEGISRHDVLQIAHEAGAVPEKNVDEAALERTVKDMDRLTEENWELVKKAFAVAEGKVAFDKAAAETLKVMP